MSLHNFLKHGINYDQLRIDAGLLIGLIADDNLSQHVHDTCSRLVNVITEIQMTVVNADLLNADDVYGPEPNPGKNEKY